MAPSLTRAPTLGDDGHDQHRNAARTIEPRGHGPPDRHAYGGPADGDLHLGNYVGAIRPLADLAVDPGRGVYVFVADLHALNSRPDPEVLRERSRRLVAALLACGLDRPNVQVYRQSRVPAVAGMVALLANVTAKGLLNRAHAYKAAVAANLAADATPTTA